MFKKGDVVFFKVGRKSSARKAMEGRFQGHGFGMFMGHVPPFAKDPPPDHLLRVMGECGFLSFDDIGEFFGNEIGAECVKKFEDKYYGKVVPAKDPAQEELPVDQGSPVDKSVTELARELEENPMRDRYDPKDGDDN